MNERVKKLLGDLDGFILEEIEKAHLPGIAVGIVHGDEVIYSKTWGYADLETKQPMTDGSVFRIASIAKTFTAIGIMQQYEMGKFQLDDDVNQYLPADYGFVGYKKGKKVGKNNPVTFRRLMTHTAGVGELKGYSSILHPGTLFEFVNPKKKSLLPLSKLYRKGIKTNVPPGTKYAYANHGIAFLGHLLEILSGEQFHEYLRAHVFEPVGMGQTDAFQSDRVKPHFARGYKWKKKKTKFKPTPFLRSWIRPAGGIYSCLRDLQEYLKVLLSGGTTKDGLVLNRETLELMWTPHFRRDPRLGAIGLVFFLKSLAGHKFVYHGGLDLGFATLLGLLPDDDLGFIILCNRAATKSVYNIGRFIAFGGSGIDYPGVPTAEDNLLPLDELKRYTGTFGPPPGLLTNTRVYMGPWEYRIKLRDDQLVLKALVGGKKDGVRLWRVDPSDATLFEVREKFETTLLEPSEKLVFQRDENGYVAGFYKGLMEYVRRDGIRSLRFKFIVLSILATCLIVLFLLLSLELL